MKWWMMLLFPMVAFAKVWPPVSPDFNSVQNQLNACVDGDTLQIAAGTASWSSLLSVTKAIYIIGAGTNSTVINNNYGRIISLQPTSNKPCRLSGIKFIMPVGISATDCITVSGPSKQIRIDRCHFYGGDRVIGFNSQFSVLSSVAAYGVVDHCTFFNNSRAIWCQGALIGDGGSEGRVDWANTLAPYNDPLLPGTTNLVYVESCSFDRNLDPSNGDPTMIYGQGGGRFCFRSCSFTGTDGYIDKHGDAYNVQYTSVMFYEVYSNRFTKGPYGNGGQNTSQFFANNRGGMAMYHDNVFDGKNYVLQLVIDTTGRDPYHETTNLFYWNNTMTNYTQVNDPIQLGDNPYCPGCAENQLHLNIQYFEDAPSNHSTNIFASYTQLGFPHPLVKFFDGGSTTTPIVSAISGQTTNWSGSQLSLSIQAN